MVLEGDPAKIHKALGWQTEIAFERTLTDLLELATASRVGPSLRRDSVREIEQHPIGGRGRRADRLPVAER
jgi:hypothetical protein